MTMQWLKLYSEARTDRKLAMLTLAERGVWVNLLCYASDQSERGAFDASDRLSLALECADGDEAVLASTLDKLQYTRHLVPNSQPGWLIFRTFEARQARRESDKPDATRERQRRSRETRRATDTPGHEVSRGVTRDNAKKRHVTSVTRNVTRKRDVTTLDIENREREIPQLEGISDSHTDPPSLKAAGAAVDVASVDEVPLSDTAILSMVPGTPTPPDSAAPPSPPSEARASPAAAAASGGKSSKVNPYWDALVEAFGYEPKTRDERNLWGRTVKDLKEAKATPEEIVLNARYHAAAGIHWDLTIRSIVTHWGELNAARLRAERSTSNGKAAHRSGGRPAGATGASRPLASRDRVIEYARAAGVSVSA